MTISENGLNFIKGWEKLVLHSYLDSADIPTIGYGSIQYTNGQRVQMGETVTEDEADLLLKWEVNMKANQISPMIKPSLNQNQSDALISFAYNCGTGAFKISTLRKLINNNPSDKLITGSFLVWDKIHKDGALIVSAGLLARRTAEAKIYFS